MSISLEDVCEWVREREREREGLDDYLGNLGHLSTKRKPKIFATLANK